MNNPDRTLLRWALFFAALGIACLACLTGRAANLTTTAARTHIEARHEAQSYANASPRPKGHPTVPRVFRVLPTGSMRPVLDDRHWVVIEACPWHELRAGDIAVFLHVRTAREAVQWGRGSQYLMHEVVGVRGGVAYASGLASIKNPHPHTERFGPAEFVGVVMRSWKVSRG